MNREMNLKGVRERINFSVRAYGFVSRVEETDIEWLFSTIDQQAKQIGKMSEALTKIKILNAGKDGDINWLCEKAAPPQKGE